MIRIIKYDTALKAFTYEKEGVIFSYKEEPEPNFEEEVLKIFESYNKNILNIINFMLTDIQSMYGEVDIEYIKKTLGNPIIDIQNGQVTYCEQGFDDLHIFSFEFFDDDFLELQYFSIDG